MLADLAVPALADVCLVDTLESATLIERVGVAAVDRPLANELRGSFELPSTADHGISRVMQRGQLELISQIAAGQLDALFQATHRRSQFHSMMIVPLVARDTLGCVTLIRATGSNDPYISADLDLAESLALDNARLFRDATTAIQARDRALATREDVLRFVSHDLKNPLTSIRLHTRRRSDRSKRNRRDYETIRSMPES
jgi:signal transduction histidine kinase